MFVVRVHFKNGVLLTYAYRDAGQAHVSAETISEAQKIGAQHPHKGACYINDEAMREAWIDGAQVAAVQLIDIEAEIVMETRLQLMSANIQQQLLDRAGANGATGAPVPKPPRVPMAEPPDAYAARQAGQFAA